MHDQPPSHHQASVDDRLTLHRRAETRLLDPAAQLPGSTGKRSPQAILQLLHELQVQQSELEKQNDEMRRARTAPDVSQARYFDLYNLAPVGRVTISELGLINHVNLTVATLIGLTPDTLIRQPISRFILTEDQHFFDLFLQRLLDTDEPLSCELRMVKTDSTLFWAHLVAMAAAGNDGTPVLRLVLCDITERKRAEEERRIAAIAFECQEGIIVTDARRVILRTNHSFTRIMGYTNAEVVGKTTAFMRSDRHPASFYDAAWETAQREGAWQAEVWHQRKNGEVFAQWLTSTAVKDEHGAITHFVVTHTDITTQKQQEQERLRNETAQRNLLVREVHHRIKNNLQGITGLLRQSAQQHPETAGPINQAIGQVQGISVIHGLQGRADASLVRLCELTRAIAGEIEILWQIPVSVDIPAAWIPCVIAETEAVPIALVLHELMLNAVKHGGQAQGYVRITLRKGDQPDRVQVTIVNAGQLAGDAGPAAHTHNGLQLVTALMPRDGARLVREQQGAWVRTMLELQPPVTVLELKTAP